MLVVLGIMVLVHELGHFAVAKFFGVRVEVFSIGFGKRLWGFRRGDTDYRISLLPLGGYVKMSGEMGGDGTLNTDTDIQANPRDPGDLSAHPRWQRILIGLAGPAANFVFAFVLMTGLYMMYNEVADYANQPVVLDFVPQNSPAARAGLQQGDRITSFDVDQNPNWEQVAIRASIDMGSTVPVTVLRGGQTVSASLTIPNPGKADEFNPETVGLLPRMQNFPIRLEELEPGMPAERAGLKAGDIIESVDGQQFHNVRSLLDYLQQVSGHAVDLTIGRGGQTQHITIQPQLADDENGRKEYRLGFRPNDPPYHVMQLPLLPAVKKSVNDNVHFSGMIVSVLRRLFTRNSNVRQLSGPIGIARQTGEAISIPGWQPIINLMALISLNLGIFNLLPIPILDGGMILLLLIEGILRRDLNQEFKERVYQVAFVVLILFAAFVMFNDVSKLNILSKLKP